MLCIVNSGGQAARRPGGQVVYIYIYIYTHTHAHTSFNSQNNKLRVSNLRVIAYDSLQNAPRELQSPRGWARVNYTILILYYKICTTYCYTTNDIYIYIYI